jgi:hypothetical protein
MKQLPSLAANLRGVGMAALLLAPGFPVLAIRSGIRWVAAIGDLHRPTRPNATCRSPPLAHRAFSPSFSEWVAHNPSRSRTTGVR